MAIFTLAHATYVRMGSGIINPSIQYILFSIHYYYKV